MTFKRFAYKALAFSNDIHAIRKGRAPRRLLRRIYGRVSGRVARRLFG